MIAIIEYGMGNVASIANMLKKIGVEATITNSPNEIDKAEKIILPGVGSYDYGMQELEKYGLTSVIKEMVMKRKKPLLGICLGMQLLGKGSEEGELSGLNLIPFECKKFVFPEDTDLKIPHMGWDIIESYKKNDPLLCDVSKNQRYYFVHSYHAVCENKKNVLMTCDYGYQFVAAVKEKNIYGVQFHPEKSHKFGMIVLKNFAEKVF